MDVMALMLSILGLAILYVLVPVTTRAYLHARGPRRVICPETNAPTTIEIDATRAALGAATGRSDVRIVECKEWPAHRDCAQACRAQVDIETAPPPAASRPAST